MVKMPMPRNVFGKASSFPDSSFLDALRDCVLIGASFRSMNISAHRADSDDGNRAAHDPKWLLHSLLDTAQDCIYFKDRESRFIKINPAHAKIFGLGDPEEVVGKTDFDFFDEKHARKAYEDEQRIITTGKPLKNVEEMETWPDGSVTWCSTTKVPVFDDNGTVVGIVGISRDITERKLQETHIRQVNRLYAAMSQMNRTILRARTRGQLFHEVCRVLVESGHFDMAWVGMAGTENPKVEPAAEFGDNQEYLRRIQIFHDDRPEGCGPVGTAIREGTTQVVNDFQDNPRTAPWHAEAQKSGWHSCFAAPIRLAGKVAGALSVYSKVPGYFGEKEIILLERAADDISSALEMIDALAAARS